MLIILQIFFATRAFLKIGEHSWIFPSFSWGIFGQVACLDQSHGVKIFDGLQCVISVSRSIKLS